MRTRLDDLVLGRLAEDGAVPALTCYDSTTAPGIVSAAEFGRSWREAAAASALSALSRPHMTAHS